MDYKKLGDKYLKEEKYREFYQAYTNYHKNTSTDESLQKFNKAKEKYELFLELEKFLKKDSNDYYNLLGVDTKCTQEEIKNAYHKLMKKYHPRITRISLSEEVIRRVIQAYSVLNNKEKRIEYDRKNIKQTFIGNQYSNFDHNVFFRDRFFRNMSYNDVKFFRYMSNDFNTLDDIYMVNSILYQSLFRFPQRDRIYRINPNNQMYVKVTAFILLMVFMFLV